MKFLLVTNNSKAEEYCREKMQTEFLEIGGYMDVLYKTRDLIHAGMILHSHPLAGSLKPNQTPYKSIVLVDEGEDKYQSIMLIEAAIETAQKFLKIKGVPPWPERIRNDFKTVDLSFIKDFTDKQSKMIAG